VNIITVSASKSNLGKTTLIQSIKNALSDDAFIIKIGHGTPKENQPLLLHDVEEALTLIETLKTENKYKHCIIESNQILGHIKPNLAIFIENKEDEKPSAELAKKQSHIVINNTFDIEKATNFITKNINFSPEDNPKLIHAIEDFYFDYLIHQLSVKTKVWLEKDSTMVFGPGKYILLKKVDELSSLNKAAKELGMSYRHAWAYVQAMEKRLGHKIFEPKIATVKNSGSKLTPFAKKLIAKYELLIIKHC
jgi:molybdate transport system regulatory protein